MRRWDVLECLEGVGVGVESQGWIVRHRAWTYGPPFCWDGAAIPACYCCRPHNRTIPGLPLSVCLLLSHLSLSFCSMERRLLFYLILNMLDPYYLLFFIPPISFHTPPWSITKFASSACFSFCVLYTMERGAGLQLPRVGTFVSFW